MNAQLKPLDARPVFAQENSSQVTPEQIDHLLNEHYEEVKHDDVPVGCDYEYYRAADRLGLLRLYTVRVLGELVGYGIFMVAYSKHYKTNFEARQDTLFLSKEYRKGSTGLRFMRWFEAQLQAEGVKRIFQHGKFAKDIRSIYERMGYEPIYYVYSKRLN